MKSPHTLMVQGTTSDAGKSVLVTALCRVLARHDVRVVPFKPQNMALNSAVSCEGLEIGRAQAVQAQACFLEPSVKMNPVLLKPNSNAGSQVIVHGKAIGNMDARAYQEFKPQLLKEVVNVHEVLKDEFEVVIVEGAGSPAEINLRANDIANMGFAEAVDCSVIIVADIDRGGVFAHLYGTWSLLSDSEKLRVKGFVINRFRGDASLLESAISWLYNTTKVPVIAVIPYILNLHIEAEDSVALQNYQTNLSSTSALKVTVIHFPHISNFTDFDPLRQHPQVDCLFSKDVDSMQGSDLIILPGSKNVRSDLAWLNQNTWFEVIQRHLRLGGKIMGICGGYQMLGNIIHDPDGVEGEVGSSRGLSLIDMETVLTAQKDLKQVEGVVAVNAKDKVVPVEAYEIHSGRSLGPSLNNPVFLINGQNEGAWADNRNILGTYLHGLFDLPETLSYLLNWAGLTYQDKFDYPAFREQEINRLADAVEETFPYKKLCSLINLPQ